MGARLLSYCKICASARLAPEVRLRLHHSEWAAVHPICVSTIGCSRIKIPPETLAIPTSKLRSATPRAGLKMDLVHWHTFLGHSQVAASRVESMS